jgi:hypothetical protein
VVRPDIWQSIDVALVRVPNEVLKGHNASAPEENYPPQGRLEACQWFETACQVQLAK